MTPWEKFVAVREIPTNRLHDVVSVRAKEFAVSYNLVEEHFVKDGELLDAEVFINRASGEIGFRPSQNGYSMKRRKKDGKGACILHARNFLKVNPVKKGRYEARWDQDNELLIIKAWEKQESSGIVDFCPQCEELGFKKGVCPHCGYTEDAVRCPEDLTEPFEREDEVCRDCRFYKRKWGDRPARCSWEGWHV